MDAPAASSDLECPRCRELEVRLLEVETKLRDLEDRLKPPSPKRPVESQSPAPAKVPTGSTYPANAVGGSRDWQPR